MTSEPDSKEGRRPPTIELKATEVHDAAATADASGAADDAAAKQASGAKETFSRPSGRSSRLISHAIGALVGAVVMGAIIAGLWSVGVVPPRQATEPASTTASEVPAPSIGQDISARLDRVERAIETQPDLQALAARVATVETQTKSLSDSLATLSHRLDDVAATSENAAKQAQAAKTASDNASQASQANIQKSDLEALTSRVAALESTVKGLAESAGHPATSGNDQAARMTIAAEALRAAVERGTPYQAELASVQALGLQQSAAAPLEAFAASGVPSAAALAHELANLIPALRHVVEASPGATTFLGRLEANARQLVRIAPVEAPVGNAPSAVIARIESDVSRADIAAALTDVAALPDSAKLLAADWVEKANMRQAALEASRQIAADALAGLSKPTSQ